MASPMHQFEVVDLHPLAFGDYDVSFTNSALWMAIALCVIGIFMFGEEAAIILVGDPTTSFVFV